MQKRTHHFLPASDPRSLPCFRNLGLATVLGCHLLASNAAAQGTIEHGLEDAPELFLETWSLSIPCSSEDVSMANRPDSILEILEIESNISRTDETFDLMIANGGSDDQFIIILEDNEQEACEYSISIDDQSRRPNALSGLDISLMLELSNFREYLRFQIFEFLCINSQTKGNSLTIFSPSELSISRFQRFEPPNSASEHEACWNEIVSEEARWSNYFYDNGPETSSISIPTIILVSNHLIIDLNPLLLED